MLYFCIICSYAVFFELAVLFLDNLRFSNKFSKRWKFSVVSGSFCKKAKTLFVATVQKQAQG